MFTNSFSVLFYLKRRSNYVSGDLPIYLRITASGHRIELATKRTCEPEKWNSAAGRKSGTKEDTRLLNAYLDTLQSKVYEIHRQLIAAEQEVTVETIKAKLTGQSEKKQCSYKSSKSIITD